MKLQDLFTHMIKNIYISVPMLQFNECPHFLYLFFNILFLQLSIVIWRLRIVYAGEDSDSNVSVMITLLVLTIWTSMSAVPKGG